MIALLAECFALACQLINETPAPGLVPGLKVIQTGSVWALARCKLRDVFQSSATPIAQEGLAQIQAFYRTGKDMRAQSAEQRRAARQGRSKPLIDASALWLAQNRARVSAKSTPG